MKKILPVAVAAALAGVNSAQAVNVADTGLGQVLLYPFYTVEGGQDTLINLVNTTDQVKAVKVRILESMNSVEVLDFNLYLSPEDHWSAVITADPAGEGAVIRTADTSCTVPNGLSQGDTVPFRNVAFLGDTIDNSLARTREGYVEVIEMGDIDMTTTFGAVVGTAATHVAGVPASCGTVEAAWQAGGNWSLNANDSILAPSGGLYGYGVLIDVAEGTDATYDATAIDHFSTIPLHFQPGNTQPSLEDGELNWAFFDTNATVAAPVTGSAVDAIDAVSAVLMADSIANDYVLEEAIQAGTDWVVTFPTKRSYVNAGPDPLAPFTDIWEGAAATPAPACEVVQITYYDREEGREGVDPLDYSPPRPGPAPNVLCAEANVISFNESNVLKASDRTITSIPLDFENGWASLSMNESVFGGSIPAVVGNGTARKLDAGGPDVLNGLPVIGFAVQKYVNGDLGGVLSNYAGSVTHKTTKVIGS